MLAATIMIIPLAMICQMPQTFTSRIELMSLVIRLMIRPSLVLS